MDLSNDQRELARHALGLPNRGRQSYRNHFVTGDGSPDYQPWCDMVEAGAARMFPGNALTGGDPCFVLTHEGASAALSSGERLSHEDFPTEERS